MKKVLKSTGITIGVIFVFFMGLQVVAHIEMNKQEAKMEELREEIAEIQANDGNPGQVERNLRDAVSNWNNLLEDPTSIMTRFLADREKIPVAGD